MDITVNQELLEEFWKEAIGPAAGDKDFNTVKFAFVDTFRRMAGPYSRDINLYLTSKVLSIKVKEHLYHSLVTEAITGVLLQHFGAAEIPALMVTGIVHVLTGARRIEIEGGAEAVYLSLSIDHGFKGLHSIDEWYEKLPEELRKQVHPLDFADIMNQLVYAGFAAAEDGKYLVFERGKHQLKVRLSWN